MKYIVKRLCCKMVQAKKAKKLNRWAKNSTLLSKKTRDLEQRRLLGVFPPSSRPTLSSVTPVPHRFRLRSSEEWPDTHSHSHPEEGPILQYFHSAYSRGCNPLNSFGKTQPPTSPPPPPPSPPLSPTSPSRRTGLLSNEPLGPQLWG